jgi:hypothetical protein
LCGFRLHLHFRLSAQISLIQRLVTEFAVLLLLLLIDVPARYAGQRASYAICNGVLTLCHRRRIRARRQCL